MAYRDINGNEYNSLEDIPEGAIFGEIDLQGIKITKNKENWGKAQEQKAEAVDKFMKMAAAARNVKIANKPKVNEQ